MFRKITQDDVTKYLDNFCAKIIQQERLKIAQSGHTDRNENLTIIYNEIG